MKKAKTVVVVIVVIVVILVLMRWSARVGIQAGMAMASNNEAE